MKFYGDVVALDGVDLDVEPGQIHGVVGPNGAGKTTLLGILLGLAFADGGSLEVEGRSSAASPVDQPKLLQGSWVRPGGVIIELESFGAG